MSRTKNSMTNLTVSIIGQILGMIISFVARIFFVRILGTEYLGINGLFTNILTMLTLVELGVGPAIVFSLYKPLADNDYKKVKSLMQLYKKAYITIGIVIAGLGLLITPLVNYVIKEMPDVPNLRVIFMLFVINSSISYFFVYKSNLIIAHQHRYIVSIYRYAFLALLNILQIIFLYLTKSYIVFLLLQISCTFLENFTVSKRAEKIYPFLKSKEYEKLDAETINEIKKNTGALVLHKIGSIAVNSTNNIIISAKVGIIWVGYYSNYILIINALNSMIGQFFIAINASVGNLGATESNEKSLAVFQNIQFFNFWIYGFSSTCLFYLLNPFIELWLGFDLLMSMDVVSILVINFYIQGMRKSVLTFKEAFGLYWYDRYKPLFEVLINLVLSLKLSMVYGIVGIFISAFISTITTCFWVEPYVLYKYGFNASLKTYFLKYAIYSFATVAAVFLTGQCLEIIAGNNILTFIYKTLICVFIPNMIYLILFYHTKEFKYFWKVFKEIVLIRLLKIKKDII